MIDRLTGGPRLLARPTRSVTAGLATLLAAGVVLAAPATADPAASAFAVTGTVAIPGSAAASAVDPSTRSAYVTQSGGDSVAVVDLTTGAVTDTIKVGADPSMIALDAGIHRAYVANGSGHSVSIVDTTSRSVIRTVPLAAAPKAVAVDPTTHAAYVTAGGRLDEIDAGTGTVRRSLAIGADADGLAVDPPAAVAYIVDGADRRVAAVDLATFTIQKSLTKSVDHPTGVALDPLTHTLYVAYGDGAVASIDLATGATKTIKTGGAAGALALDGARLYVADPAGRTVAVVDTASRAVVSTVTVAGPPIDLAVDPTTHTAYATTPDALVAITENAATPTPHPAVRAAAAAPAAADLTKAVTYLTTTTGANGGTGGTSLAHDGYYTSFAPSADFGLTIDGALALAGAKSDNPVLAKVVQFLATDQKDGSGQGVDDWTGIGTDFASGGAIGKEALLAEVTGYDPRTFGGHDLIAALDGAVCTGPLADSSCVAAGNFVYTSSTFGQADGVLAQLRAGDVDAAPLAFLEGLQNANGSWPSLIPASGDADVDSTAIAAMTLALLPGDPAAAAAVRKALAWIATQPQGDGGFLGAAGESTNSTALAIMGMTLAGTTDATQLAAARTFLAGQQEADGGFTIAPGVAGSDVRASAQVVSGLVGTSFGTLSDDVAAPPPAGDPPAGAAYLVTQLVDGTHLDFAGTATPNYGGTADLAIALAATGTQDPALAAVVGYLEQHVADYADPAGTAASFPGPYSGAVAKLALLAEITGQDPTAFGGFDLVATLTGHVCTTSATDGSCSAAGDFYQSFSGVSQSLGVLALARADVTPPAAAVARLEQLQCPDGGFSSELVTPGSACTSDVDTSGYAVQALAAVPGTSAVIAAAVGFLLAARQPDGGFIGATGENADSTALAVQALVADSNAAAARLQAAAGRRPAADRAVATTAAAPSPGGLATSITAGIAWLDARQTAAGGFALTATDSAADPVATAQAVPAVAHSTLTTLRHAITVTSAAGGTGGTPPSAGGTTGADQLAFTGIDVRIWLAWAVALLLTGFGALLAGSGRGPARRKSRRA